MTPLPPIAHILAAALAVFAALTFLPKLAPDLPGDGIEPGVSSSSAPAAVKGGAPDSLLRPVALTAALDSVSDQVAAGEQIQVLHIEPGQISVESGGADGFSVSDVDPTAITRITGQIAAMRPDFKGLDDISFAELRYRPGGPRWYFQLSLDITPPRTFGAQLDGSAVVPGE